MLKPQQRPQRRHDLLKTKPVIAASHLAQKPFDLLLSRPRQTSRLLVEM
jgi:hypothetical protein